MALSIDTPAPAELQEQPARRGLRRGARHCARLASARAARAGSRSSSVLLRRRSSRARSSGAAGPGRCGCSAASCSSLGALFALAAGLGLGPALTPMPRPSGRGELVVSGPYAVVRHPIYSGVAAAALGFSVLVSSWWSLGVSLLARRLPPLQGDARGGVADRALPGLSGVHAAGAAPPDSLAHLIRSNAASARSSSSAREGGGHLDPQPRRPLRHDREAEARDEDALLEQPLAEADRVGGLADDDRDDRPLARERVEAELDEAPAEVVACSRAGARSAPARARAPRARPARCRRPSAAARSRRAAAGSAARAGRTPLRSRRRSRRPLRRAPCRACR